MCEPDAETSGMLSNYVPGYWAFHICVLASVCMLVSRTESELSDGAVHSVHTYKEVDSTDVTSFFKTRVYISVDGLQFSFLFGVLSKFHLEIVE